LTYDELAAATGRTFPADPELAERMEQLRISQQAPSHSAAAATPQLAPDPAMQDSSGD
jgi:hypothetical protein